ncbi:50S ribosomal protein L29 [Terricaulis sp.]|uniref:50S ribosomal protein L29 n=1 Tax=Terricaulis sp. TaxID=2768686 RepID=UPI003784F0F5
MKLREIREELKDSRSGDAAKLGEELADLKKEQFNLRFQQATGQLEKSSRMKDVRRAIARAKTVLREKQPSKTKV